MYNPNLVKVKVNYHTQKSRSYVKQLSHERSGRQMDGHIQVHYYKNLDGVFSRITGVLKEDIAQKAFYGNIIENSHIKFSWTFQMY